MAPPCYQNILGLALEKLKEQYNLVLACINIHLDIQQQPQNKTYIKEKLF